MFWCSRFFNCAACALSFVGLAMTFPTGVAAQERTRVMSSALLKRIAEAVEGRSTSDTLFVLVRSDSQTVITTARMRPEVEALARRLAEKTEIHGPYAGSVDLGPLADIVPSECVHDGYSSVMQPAHICNYRAIRMSEVLSMSLAFRMRDGSTRTIDLPRGSDAVFLSFSAFDKFVFPYYERINGLEATANMRQRMLQQARASR